MKYKDVFAVFVIILALFSCAPFWQSKKKPEKPEKKESPPREKTVNREFPFRGDEVFFTEPYNYLNKPIKDKIAMSLDLDYNRVRFPYGFVNTVSPDTPPLEYKKRLEVENDKELKRIKEMSGFEKGDPVTVVSLSGNVHPAHVTGFSYVGNSPSTVTVVADLEIESEKPHESVFQSPGVAIRGKHDLSPGPLSTEDPLEPDAPLARKLADLCSADIPADESIENTTVRPAELVKGESPYYFVSFWHRPEDNFEIEDVKLKACMFHSRQGVWRKMVLPIPFKLLQVYDLDDNGQAELFVTTGDSSRMCLAYLVPEDKGYRILRQGLCSGY